MIKRIGALVASSALIAGLAACGSSGSSGASPSASGATGSTITIGLSIAETGNEAIPTLLPGYQEAVTEANAAGGLLVGTTRHPVKLIVLDNQSSTSLLTEQVHTLVLQDHAVALVSGCCDLNVAEAPLANALKVPLVGTAIPNELIAKDNGAWAWNIYINLFDPALFTTAVPSLGPTNKTVAVIGSSDPEGEGANQLTAAEAAAGGYKVAVKSLVPIGTTDFSSFIEQAEHASAQVLVAQMPGPDCFALWKQMKALGYVPKVTVANQCGANPTWSSLGSLGDGALLGMNWTPASGLPQAQALAATFGKTYPGDVVDQEAAVTSYSAMQVLLTAITRAGSTSAAAVNAAIGKTDGAFPLGTIKFDSSHDWGGRTYLAQWQNGKVVQVYPKAAGVTAEFPPSGLAG